MNTKSTYWRVERIDHVVSDHEVDNSLYVEDEHLERMGLEFYNVLHISRCCEDMTQGIYNRIDERKYVGR